MHDQQLPTDAQAQTQEKPEASGDLPLPELGVAAAGDSDSGGELEHGGLPAGLREPIKAAEANAAAERPDCHRYCSGDSGTQ